MRGLRSRVVAWSPAELACAPRPISGELLSSWLRRVATANNITLPELEACIGRLMGQEEGSAVPDYCPPKGWQFAVASLTRVPERWVWALGLEQHFPAADRDSFLHECSKPHSITASFCPECFQDQIATQHPLHLKAEWSLATTTRCFHHHSPLYLCCPWCGSEAPIHFRSNDAVECMVCEHDLAIRRWTWGMPNFEPVLARFEQAVAEAFAGQAPDPSWIGPISAVAFRDLVHDLIWMLTSEDLGDAYHGHGLALVDRMMHGRFAPSEPYGSDFESPLFNRCWAEREMVIAAMILIMQGAEADRALGVGGSEMAKTASFRPFVEVLRATAGKSELLWKRLRRWPRDIQDRASGALRYLQSEKGLLIEQRKLVDVRSPPDNGPYRKKDMEMFSKPASQVGS